VFRNSKPTTSVRRGYQGISLASSPTNHTPLPQLYRLFHFRVNLHYIRNVPGRYQPTTSCQLVP